MTEGIIADASHGSTLMLSKYLTTAVLVTSKTMTPDGPVLKIESSGGSEYRLRAVDDDDGRLLMEKPTDDGWEPFIRLTADFA